MVNNSIVDMVTMTNFGIFGYLLRKYKYETAPLALAFVLGPMLEMSFRQSLSMSDGSFSIFINRPIAVTCLSLAFILLLFPLVPFFSGKRKDLAKMAVDE
jgi:putative tricarboxylic transport membrane protein